MSRLFLSRNIEGGNAWTGAKRGRSGGVVEHFKDTDTKNVQVSQKQLVVESPWSQLTSECQRFGHPPRLDK